MTETDRLRACQKKIEALELEIQRLKQVQSDLGESEEKYRLLVEHANDAIFVVQGGQVKFPNNKGKQIARQLSLDPEKMPFINYVHPDDREMVIDRHRRRLRGEDPPNNYSIRLVGKQGRELKVSLSAVRISWEGRPATLNFVRDITDQKEAQAQLDQALRLEALGAVAGGVAHDFNNLLMSIQANAAAMRLGADATAGQCEMLDGILHSVSSGEAMTRELMGFARKDTFEFRPTDVNRFLLQTVAIFDRTRHGLKIQTDFENHPWTVAADPLQLERVLLNLFVNADQAMPDGGNLQLVTRNVTIGRHRARQLGLLSPGQYVRISAADDGPGMAAATLERVFEPFFTTKGKDRGNGLGLACALGIVQNHRGSLVAASQEGAGACFDIFLPVSSGPCHRLPG